MDEHRTIDRGRGADATPEPGGLVLAPFRALRYNRDQVHDLALVTSPPYDLIDEAQASGLEAAQPYNIVRLILPRDDEPDERYRHAGDRLARWRDQGVLVPDETASLYVYEQRRGEVVLQRGLLGGVGLAAPERGVVLPHEDVLEGPIADRLALMLALDANPEPIFLLYDGAGPASALVAAIAEGRPVATAEGSDGLTHRLWPIADPVSLSTIAADLLPRQALIADGHHRYATYRRLQNRRRAEGLGSGPWDYGLALLVDRLVHPPVVQGIHRVVPGLAPDRAAKLASAGFAVTALNLDPTTPDGLARALDVLDAQAAGSTAFLLAGDGQAWLLDAPDPVALRASFPAGHSERWCHLDASVAHSYVLGALWGTADVDGAVEVRHVPMDAVLLAAKTGGSALLLRPPPLDDVLVLAQAGEHMPRKSTSFGPKPRTGLVIRTLSP